MALEIETGTRFETGAGSRAGHVGAELAVRNGQPVGLIGGTKADDVRPADDLGAIRFGRHGFLVF